jgi:hypothetical protein
MADVINVNRIYMTTAKKESRDNERSFETWKTETKEKTLPFVVSFFFFVVVVDDALRLSGG